MKTFNEFISEGLRDKMVPKSEDEINNTIDEILVGDAEEIIDNLHEHLEGIDDGNTYYDVIFDMFLKMDIDFVKNNVFNLIEKNINSEFNDKLQPIKEMDSMDDVHDLLFNELFDTEYMYAELIIDLFKLYDINKTKQIAVDGLRDKMVGKSDEEISYNMNKLLSGNTNKEIYDNIYNSFLKNELIIEGVTIADCFLELLTTDELLEVIKKAFNDTESYDELVNILNNTETEILQTAYNILYNDYEFLYDEMLETLIDFIDEKLFKRIAKRIIEINYID
jgi:hypothetical protein